MKKKRLGRTYRRIFDKRAGRRKSKKHADTLQAHH